MAAQSSTETSALSADGTSVQNGLAAAIPALITALSRNAQSKDGAEALDAAIAKDHDGSVIDNIGTYLQNPNLDDGNGILKHALGGQQESVQQGLSAQTGLDPQMIAKLLQMAAPLVLGMLAKQKQQQGLNADGLSDLLQQERAEQSQKNPDLMGMLTGMLDQDKDGGFMDDVQSMAGKLFGRRNNE